MKQDPINTHVRDELGITAELSAQPIQAAMASAGAFCAGAVVPVAIAAFAPRDTLILTLSIVTLILLAVLGAVGACAGGASLWRGALRVTFWGALALGVTSAVGKLFGTAI